MMEDNAKLYSEIYQTMKLLIHVLIVNLLMEECQVENGAIKMMANLDKVHGVGVIQHLNMIK